jgi:hypothetical protein
MPDLRSRTRDTDFSLIDLPRTKPIDDPHSYLQAALRWHFSPDTGSPYWLDPRWVKKLVARGAAETAAYVVHIIEQAGYILRTQDVTILTTTPPLLQAIARDDDLVAVINDKVRRIQGGGAHFGEDTRGILREIFPNAAVRNIYGSTMILGGAKTREGLPEGDPVIHDAQSPYITFSVIDPQTGRSVPYGERGQVVMNHISKTMFLPNNLERDTAIRVPGPEGQVGDSVSEVKPVETFGRSSGRSSEAPDVVCRGGAGQTDSARYRWSPPGRHSHRPRPGPGMAPGLGRARGPRRTRIRLRLGHPARIRRHPNGIRAHNAGPPLHRRLHRYRPLPALAPCACTPTPSTASRS